MWSINELETNFERNIYRQLDTADNSFLYEVLEKCSSKIFMLLNVRNRVCMFMFRSNMKHTCTALHECDVG